MALNVPSLDELSRKGREAYAAAAGLTEKIIWPNTDAIAAKVNALVLQPVYLRQARLYDQLFASSADALHLENRHAYERGIRRRQPSAASGSLDATGEADKAYPAGIGWLYGNILYTTTAPATADGAGAIVFEVEAAERGALTNVAAGEILTIADPAQYPTIDPSATVGADGLGGGADEESVEALRARVLQRKQKPPQGGSQYDYEAFAREVPGVVRAFADVYLNGPTTIGVWFTMADRPDLIPTPEDVQVVDDWIAGKRMIRVAWSTNAPTAQAVDMEIKLVPDTAALREKVEQNVRAMFALRPVPAMPSASSILPRAWISEAISDTVGEFAHDLVAPAADITYTTPGDLAVPGTFTWLA